MASYGIGQYRFSPATTYYSDLFKDSNNLLNPELYTVELGSLKYQDIIIPLTDSEGNYPVKYGNSYYMTLSLPKHYQYTLDITLKLCGQTNNEIDLSKYQFIKKFSILPSGGNNKYYSDVLLYELPDECRESVEDPLKNNWVRIGFVEEIDNNNDIFNDDNLLPFMIYKNGNDYYYYYYKDNELTGAKIENCNFQILDQTWNHSEADSESFDLSMVFSPMYDLEDGYPYLYLEIDRTPVWNNDLQYISSDGETYNGVYLDPEKIECHIYSIKNLLGENQSGDIKTSNSSGYLNHIAVWGHPNMILMVNGEEIRIGNSKLYELTDYEITQLGVIADCTKDEDRFTIDYEYITN